MCIKNIGQNNKSIPDSQQDYLVKGKISSTEIWINYMESLQNISKYGLHTIPVCAETLQSQSYIGDLTRVSSLVWGGKKKSQNKLVDKQKTSQIICFIILKHWVLNLLFPVYPGSSEGVVKWQSAPQQAQGPAFPPRTGKEIQITQAQVFAQEMCHSAKICLATDRETGPSQIWRYTSHGYWHRPNSTLHEASICLQGQSVSTGENKRPEDVKMTMNFGGAQLGWGLP